jgi:hypothetical protein
MFPLTRTVLVFFTAGLLFFAPSSASILGSLSHPAETGLLIPSDKGEVGGSSPPRPTIIMTSKYADILTFPFGECLSKNEFANYLPTLGLAGWHYTQGIENAALSVEGAGSHA